MSRRKLIHLIFIEHDRTKSHYVPADTRLVLVWMHCHYCRPLQFFVDGVRLTQVQMTQFVEAERHYHVRLMPEEDPREPTRRNRSLVYELEEAK